LKIELKKPQDVFRVSDSSGPPQLHHTLRNDDEIFFIFQGKKKKKQLDEKQRV
jgi:hypothetical protein